MKGPIKRCMKIFNLKVGNKMPNTSASTP